MHPEETPSTPPTEGQIVPPEEQILPSGGGTMPAPEADVTDEQREDEDQGMAGKAKEAAPDSVGDAAQQAQSLARANPTPILLAVSFVAGVVVGRIASRRG
jgi:hypothetical protein